MTDSALITDVARQLPNDAPWLLRETDAETVRLFVGESPGAIRGTLDGRGYDVRESDVPVREGWDSLLEIRRGGGG